MATVSDDKSRDSRRVRSAAPISYADLADRYELAGDLRGRLLEMVATDEKLEIIIVPA